MQKKKFLFFILYIFYIQKYSYLLHQIHDGQKHITINTVNPLYLITDKIHGYIKESNGNKYLTLVPTGESKDTLKRYEVLWNIIRDLLDH